MNEFHSWADSYWVGDYWATDNYEQGIRAINKLERAIKSRMLQAETISNKLEKAMKSKLFSTQTVSEHIVTWGAEMAKLDDMFRESIISNIRLNNVGKAIGIINFNTLGIEEINIADYII